MFNMSTIARLAVGVRDAREALGDSFLEFPDRAVGALFDLCPDDPAAIRELGRVMRSSWFPSAKERLAKAEPLSENSLTAQDQWIVKVFNYAYGLKGLESNIASAPSAPPIKKNNQRLLAIVGGGLAGLSLAAIGLLALGVFGGHGTPNPTEPTSRAVASTSKPEIRPVHPPVQEPEQAEAIPVPVPVPAPTAPVHAEQPKPAATVKHPIAPKTHKLLVHESRHRVKPATRLVRQAESPPKAEPSVDVDHDTPPPN
jgi:hypothetical protein